MASKAQRKATKIHRRRGALARAARSSGPQKGCQSNPGVAETLRDESVKVKVLRSTLVKALVHPEIRTAFDVFGSDLPNEVFAGVFEQPRQRQWREINL
jgi:hypothetical protein